MLPKMRNLGPVSINMLGMAGIESELQLRTLGAVEAYRRVHQASDVKPSLNLLYAIEGALVDEPWQKIAQERKLSLLFQLEDKD